MMVLTDFMALLRIPREVIGKRRNWTYVAIGPLPMMRAVSSLTGNTAKNRGQP